MKRSALRDLLSSILLASLPAAGCRTPCATQTLTAPAVDSTDAGCAIACTAAAAPLDPVIIESCHVTVGDGGTLIARCDYTDACGTGRRTEGLAEFSPEGAPHYGAAGYLARAAALEAASITAFRRLAVELAEAGAPRDLVLRARRAAREEVRHARAVGALARDRGAEVPRLAITPRRQRTLRQVAIENAAEGCVRETYGALVAAWQAARAADTAVRSAWGAIADEEAGHAELAWDVAAFLDTRLDADSRLAVAAARHQAAAGLAREVDVPVDEETVIALGVPGAGDARVLVAALDRRLWASAPG